MEEQFLKNNQNAHQSILEILKSIEVRSCIVSVGRGGNFFLNILSSTNETVAPWNSVVLYAASSCKGFDVDNCRKQTYDSYLGWCFHLAMNKVGFWFYEMLTNV